MNKISVIIATKNRPRDLMQCLESVMTQTSPPYEIVIVDASDTDEVSLQLESLGTGANIKYLRAIGNLSDSRNQGIDNSTGDIITYLDDDVVLDKNCLAEVKIIFDNDHEGRIGAITAERIIEVGTGLRHFIAWRVLLPCYQVFAKVFLLLRYGDGRVQISGLTTIIRPGTVDQPVRVEYVYGANMSFRREVFNEIRFDPHLPYVDDDDISIQVARKYEIMYAPRARFLHNLATGGQGRGMLRWKRAAESYGRYFQKHFPQTPKYRLAFYWSTIGTFIRAIILVALRPIVRDYVSL